MESPQSLADTSEDQKVVLVLTEAFEKSLILSHHWIRYHSLPPDSMLRSSVPLRPFDRGDIGEQHDPRVQA
jgi:hypothetical protein